MNERQQNSTFDASFSIGIVMQLTDLTARQIRYYEEHQLITPMQNRGKPSGIFFKRY